MWARPGSCWVLGELILNPSLDPTRLSEKTNDAAPPSACLCCAIMPDSLQPRGLQPARLLCPWDSPCKKTGVDSHVLFQGNFPNQGLNLRLLRLLHWQAGSLPLSHQRSPYICNIAVTFLRRFNVYPPQFSDVNGHLLEIVTGYKNSPIVTEFSTSLCLVWPLNAPLFKLIVDQGLSMS